MWRYIMAGDGELIVERRATVRYEAELSARISVGSGRDAIRGITTNVSDAGVQMLIPSPVEVGTVLNFESTLFAGTGEVMWSREENGQVRVGLKFLSMSNKDRETLRDLLGKLAKAQLKEAARRQEESERAAELEGPQRRTGSLG